MKKLTATLASATLITAAGIALADDPADLALDANRMFFRYWAPGMDSGDFQVLPGNVHNPIVLPCGVTQFGGQFDIDYLGTGPTVYPKLAVTFFDDQNQAIPSQGCQGDTSLSSVTGWFNPITAGGVQPAGYYLVSSTLTGPNPANPWCRWLFQPTDLPADHVVRIHYAFTNYEDSTYAGSTVPDPNPANDARDIYVRRACSCQ